MEYPGHLEGMLDRDQRTAKLRFFNESDIKPVPKTYSFQDSTPNGTTPAKRHCCCPTRTKRPSSSSSSSTNSSHLACRNGYLLNTFQSVKNVLIVVCLTLVTLPTANSIPVKRDTMADRMSSDMKWINPCNINTGGEITENPRNTDFNSSELGKIIGEATRAFIAANNSLDDFAFGTFGKNETTVHTDFINKRLPWLETDWLGNKRLHENITADELAALKVEDVLVNVYKILQRLAVGLEQITWDQQDKGDNFKEYFANSELQLKTVLCELYTTIEAHGLKMPEYPTRDIMSVDERSKTSNTERKIRDWLILRDYINTLDFLKQSLEHLVKDLTSSPES
ncbi:uncharacterized protein LOC108906697 [Anoplophora glabripennis]|uniref:uncharacterized protein LOC108906697 n=1 Tax=Anoplophora glabripennis TaxID=217634 RepID=UPI000874674D|nr:uncharacterized protein LOC108906697 [Anoplophora glabripennis]